ncbi:MAG: hypothetical protein L3K19_05060 [Thermoplasmata archaeon]|nr:hypothetical protein [Thermoplasmata archaeon]
MGASSLLSVESAGLLLSALLLGWGGVDLVRTFAASARSKLLAPGGSPQGAWETRSLGPLLLVGLLGSGMAALAYAGAGPGWILGVAFLTAFVTSVGLEALDSAASSAVSVEEEARRLDPNAPPRIAPRHPGTRTWALAAPLVELVAVFALTGGNVPVLAGLALGAGGASLSLRHFPSPGRASPDRTGAGAPTRSLGTSDLFLCASASVLGATLVGYYAGDVRALLAGALLLPVVFAAVSVLGARVGCALWGADEGRAPFRALLARLAATSIAVVFLLFVADWWLQIGQLWVYVAAVLGVGSVVGSALVEGAPTLGATGDPGHANSRGWGSAGASVILVVLGIGVAYLVGGVQGEWHSFFLPDLGFYGVGLFAVVAVGVWPSVASASELARAPEAASVELPEGPAALGLSATLPVVAAVWSGFLVGAPLSNQVASATFLTWMTVGTNPSFVAGILLGAVLGSLSRIPLRGSDPTGTSRRALSALGLGAWGTLIVGVTLGPSAAFGTLLGIAVVGGAGFYAGRSTPPPVPAINGPAPSSPTRWASWPEAFPVELLMASLIAVVFATTFFQHGIVVYP